MQPPGDLIYVSQRKLASLAPHLGVKAHFTFSDDFDGEETPERRAGVERTLREVVARLDPPHAPLPDLDVGAGRVPDGCLFRFHRHMRIGLGMDDDTHKFRSLIVVDTTAVEGGIKSGLLMSGAPRHVRPPYRVTADASEAGRSGSSTGHLFRMLYAMREQFDTGMPASLHDVRDPLFAEPGRGDEASWIAAELYRRFAGDAWDSDPRFPPIVHPAPCQGIAQASFTRCHDETTIMFASPLFIHVRPLPATEDPPAPLFEPRRRPLARLWGRA